MKEGTIHNLVTGFETSFGGTFAKEYHNITDILEDNKVNIGGFELNITYHDENIEIEFPQINCVYTHMLGHDCHSIVAGENHANAKIAYLENIKKIVRESKSINEFKEEVKKEYPNYSGLNYLDMTASYFFPQN